MKILEFPELRQTYGYDCGAKSIQAVLAFYGKDVREDKIIKYTGTNKKGTSIKGIIKTAEKHGLKCKAEQMEIKDLKKYINKKIPVIVVLQAWTNKKKVDWINDWIDGHFVVAIGYDSKHIYFEDPSSVLRTYLSYAEFKKRWHDVDTDGKKYFNYGIIVYGGKCKYKFKKSVHMK